MSQSPQTGQFNSYYKNILGTMILEKSQSPQTGQFNSYQAEAAYERDKEYIVSIPSNGSIQFLRS